MNRGSQSLFADIFPTAATQSIRKGRNIQFDNLRNECLITRYWFYGHETGLKYQLIIKIISQQFWIAETTVTNILQLNYEILIKVRNEKPTKTDLKKKYPHLSWELPELKDYFNL